MKYALVVASALSIGSVVAAQPVNIDFDGGVAGWRTVLDGVMGGQSTGRVTQPEAGILRFAGELSLENNGGFSQTQTTVSEASLKDAFGVEARVRGDGRTYQFDVRCSDVRMMAGSFQTKFDTVAGEWVTVRLPFDQFRLYSFGRLVPNAPKLNPAREESIGVTLADKKPVAFQLDVDFIRAMSPEGPTYADRNGLDQHGELPPFYWTGDTDMACMKACVGQVLDTGFGHHIQRLMVTGNFALISGVHPRAVSDWYLGMFVDGVDWVTLPNALGMVMHADRRKNVGKGVTGLVGTKPYAASGKYIQRMSNYCTGCRYDPAERSGPAACPVTVFYWDFLIRTREQMAQNQRMAMILKNVDRMTPEARTQITIDADLLRRKLGITTRE